MIKIIAAVGKNLELGKNNGLIWRLPGDLRFFKEQTEGLTVVMGRNTFNSLPKKLPNRKHLVLTDVDDFNKSVDDVDIYYNLQDLVEAVKKLAETTSVFIIGGASVYKQFVEYAEEILLTEVDAEDNTADVYFPQFDKSEFERYVLGNGEDNGIKYVHITYLKKTLFAKDEE